MKKILLVTRPICPPWDEASKNFAYYLAKNIKDLSFGLLTKGNIPGLAENIQQRAIYTSNEFGFWQKFRLVRKLRKFKKEFDVLHFLFTPTKQNSALIKKIIGSSKKTEMKIVQTIATLREDLYSDEELKKIIFADLVITYSDHATNKLFDLGLNNVKRVYPGIDLEEYRLKEKNPELLKRCNFLASDFVINFTGEYTRLGAMDDVIEAFIRVAKEIPTAKLSLAVRIKNSADAAKKKEVVEKLKENNLLEKVAFHDDGSYQMTDIYNLCDISVFPVQDMKGKFDVPLAVIEAMACEKPVIISDLEILQEFAKENNSVQIEKGNVEQLVKKIINLYEFKEEREKIGKEARKYVETNFDIKKVAQTYQEIYEAL